MADAGYVGTSAYAEERVKASKQSKFLDSVSGKKYSKQELLDLITEWPKNAYMRDSLSETEMLQFVVEGQEFCFDLG